MMVLAYGRDGIRPLRLTSDNARIVVRRNARRHIGGHHFRAITLEQFGETWRIDLGRSPATNGANDNGI